MRRASEPSGRAVQICAPISARVPASCRLNAMRPPDGAYVTAASFTVLIGNTVVITLRAKSARSTWL